MAYVKTTTAALSVGLKEMIWRKGDERCERSYKPQVDNKPQAQVEHKPQVEHKQEQHMFRINSEGFRQVSSKREEVNSKMNDRYLVGQATQNPFMPSNNYVQDIENQMNFLTPQKSS
jgi:hypothetical protein